jgi:outer membrane protein
MRKSFKVLLPAIGLLLLNISAIAQQKIGHVNSVELLAAMPEKKTADTTLQKFKKSLDDQLKTMQGELQSKYQSYLAKKDSLAEPVRALKEQELQDLNQRIQDFQQTAQDSYEKKLQELYQPISKKAKDAVIAVGKEKGYSYVLDASEGGLVIYSSDSDNLMPAVKAKLGLK